MHRHALLDDLRNALGRERARSEPLELALYAHDAGVEHGSTSAVCFPRSTDEVATAVRIAQRHGVPFVTRGGGTGLAGREPPLDDAVVIVTTKMNRVRRDRSGGAVAWVEPGVLDLRPEPRRRGPRPALRAGSVVAAGLHDRRQRRHERGWSALPRLGVTGTHVLAVEVVLPDGSVARLGGPSPTLRATTCAAASSAARGRWASRAGSLSGSHRTPRSCARSCSTYCPRRRRGDGERDHRRGLVPAALEMMDAAITAAVEDYVGAAGTRSTPPRCSSSRSTGSPTASRPRTRRSSRSARPRHARFGSADDAERALLWKGRKSAFGAIARIAPDYYLHDAVVPRTRLVEVLREVYGIADSYDLTMMNVFHAGDGNLHPLIVFDPASPACGHGSTTPATRSWRPASRRGACCPASTASAWRNRRDAHDLRARRPRPPGPAYAMPSIPRGRQPRQGAPARQPLRRGATGSEGTWV